MIIAKQKGKNEIVEIMDIPKWELVDVIDIESGEQAIVIKTIETKEK